MSRVFSNGPGDWGSIPGRVILKIQKIVLNRFIGLVGRAFANSPGDLGSIPGCVIPKTSKMVLDTSLLIIQQYKVRIKGKVE